MRGGCPSVRRSIVRPRGVTDADSCGQGDHGCRADDRRHAAGVGPRGWSRGRWWWRGRPAVRTGTGRGAAVSGARRGPQVRVASQGAERIRPVGNTAGRYGRRVPGRGRDRGDLCRTGLQRVWKRAIYGRVRDPPTHGRECPTYGRERDTPTGHPRHRLRGCLLSAAVPVDRLLSSFVRHRVSLRRTLPFESFAIPH